MPTVLTGERSGEHNPVWGAQCVAGRCATGNRATVEAFHELPIHVSVCRRGKGMALDRATSRTQSLSIRIWRSRRTSLTSLCMFLLLLFFSLSSTNCNFAVAIRSSSSPVHADGGSSSAIHKGPEQSTATPQSKAGYPPAVSSKPASPSHVQSPPPRHHQTATPTLAQRPHHQRTASQAVSTLAHLYCLYTSYRQVSRVTH